MELKDNLMERRKQRGWSQEYLGNKIGVTRQTVSKWELGDTFPEAAKLIELSRVFGCSVDSLLGLEQGTGASDQQCKYEVHYEYKSKKMLFGLPFIHINTGRGFYRAKGIIAIGNMATGILSFGGISVGVLAMGGLSAGIVSLGGLSLALLLSVGGISVGTIAVGGLAVGIIAVGGAAFGVYSMGGCAIATRIAEGGYAKGVIAVGDTVNGRIEFPLSEEPMAEEIREAIQRTFPGTWPMIVDMFCSIIAKVT